MTAGRVLLLVVCVVLSACGGSSPSAPTTDGLTPAFAYRGETVSALDGSPIGRVAVRIGAQSAVSDENGRFDLQNLAAGDGTVVISGASIVERQKTVAVPGNGTSRETLIPASFDLRAFDEMFRGTGRLQRWTSAPALVVLAKVMQFETFATEDQYHATSERLSDSETALMIEHLTEGLALLSGNTFTRFSAITIEDPSAGSRISTLRSGSVVVGRYRGIYSLSNTIAFGRWATNGSAEVTGGAIYLDANYDRTNETRRLVRIHELGHALGYLHVTTRVSIMNPAVGPAPTEFDRQAAVIAFQRAPGNRSPDNDVADSTEMPKGGIFGTPLGRTLWSPPVF